MLYHKNSYVNFAFVIVIQYHEWPAVLLATLRKYSNNTIIVVNNLTDDLPPHYVDRNCVVINSGDSYDDLGSYNSHGAGIDAAVEYIKRYQIADYIIHIEPDCIITGHKWLDDLNNQVKFSNCYLCGFTPTANTSSIAPFHICPSIWKVDQIPDTFMIRHRKGDQSNNFNILSYNKLVKQLYESNVPEYGVWIWFHYWDTGIKNWYDIASTGKVTILDKCEGFHHFYYGRYRPPRLDEHLTESQRVILADNPWIPKMSLDEIKLLKEFYTNLSRNESFLRLFQFSASDVT